MPITRKGNYTTQGVEQGLAALCPLCEDPDDPVRWRDRQMVNINGELRWAHPGCVAGVIVFHKRPQRKRIGRQR